MSKRKKNSESLLDTNYRWPKQGDRLLRDRGEWDRAVGFDAHELSREVHIWQGYMEAAEALVRVCEEDRVARHGLVYPILFNYRHALELALKWIISRYGGYASIKRDRTDHHDLWRLWKQARAIIVEVGSEDAAIPIVERVIKDFHELDRSALAFRYSTDKQGMVIPLPDGLIDLENVRDVMEAVHHFFEGADGQLDCHASVMDDLRDEGY